MMRLRKSALFCLSLAMAFLALSSLCPATVGAQEDEFVLEDVIVTADKREADIQATPSAISAVTGDMLIRTGVNEINNLQKLMPDLNVGGGGGKFTLTTIRNVQILDFAPIAETVTAHHIDNVFLPSSVGFEGMFFDLERVEMLKGPQGTLYGKSATAGSINLITKKPVIGVFSGNAEVEYGNFDKMRFEGGINIPVAENMAMRVAYRSHRHDAYNENGYGTANTRGVRGSFLWEPNDKARLLMTIDFLDVDKKDMDSGIYFNCYGSVNCTPVELPWDSSAYYSDADQVFTRAEAWGFMAQYDHDLDFANLTVMYGHRALHAPAIGTLGGTNVIYIPPTNTAELIKIPRFPGIDSFVPADLDSVEVRLTSNTSSALGDVFEWVVGVQYQDDKRAEVVVSNFVNYDARPTTETTAIFGQATWSPLDRLHLTGGYRYNVDDKTMCSSTVEDYPDKDWPDTPVDCVEEKYKDPSYKANISYDISDDVMTYIQYARGTKVGNIETNRFALPTEELDAYEWGLKSRFLDNRLQLNLDVYYYHYKNYNQWWSGGYCISDVNGDHFCDDANGDGVVNDYDMDPFYTGSVSPGDSKSKGISMALQWLITPWDRLSANFAWQNSEYGDYDRPGAVLALYPGMDTFLQPGAGADQSGREFGVAPMRGNVSYTHTFHIGDTGTLDVTGDLYYEGDGIDQIIFMGEPNEYAMPGREAYWLGDISARYSSTYGMPSGMMWHVRVWCNNVWDSTDLVEREALATLRGQGAVFPPMSGYFSGVYVMPRTMGIAIGANW